MTDDALLEAMWLAYDAHVAGDDAMRAALAVAAPEIRRRFAVEIDHMLMDRVYVYTAAPREGEWSRYIVRAVYDLAAPPAAPDVEKARGT